MAENQIDMDKYPYKAGDVLPNGIKVITVIKGTVADTFGGYRCRVVMGLDTSGGTILGEEKIIHNLVDMSDPQNFRGGTSLKIMEYLPDPKARRVYYQIPGRPKGSVCTPEEFLEIAKGEVPDEGGETVEATEGSSDIEAPSKKICKGTTKSGEPCKRFAVEGEEYCNAHLG